MKNFCRAIGMACLGFLLVTGVASATTYDLTGASTDYVDITIPDLNGGSDVTWAGGLTLEDNENEHNTTGEQIFDMEAFAGHMDANGKLDGGVLMVGGYDVTSTSPYPAGHIFIDYTGDATYGVNSVPGARNGYDVALVIDWTGSNGIGTDSGSMELDIIGLLPTSTTVDVVYPATNDSNPWRVDLTGAFVDRGSIGFTYDANVADADVIGLAGGTHNVLGFDLVAVLTAMGQPTTGPNVPTAILHFTMECGNDNLMGQMTVGDSPQVPEPASLALLGLGVVGLALRRRFVA